MEHCIDKLPLTGHLVCFVPQQNWVHAACFNLVISEMRKRLIQIFGFLITSLGWLFVLCTMAMDYWRISQIGGQGGSFIITVAWYWSNLWKDCFTDSTAVTNCRDFPVLWSVTRKCFTSYPFAVMILIVSLSVFNSREQRDPVAYVQQLEFSKVMDMCLQLIWVHSSSWCGIMWEEIT